MDRGGAYFVLITVACGIMGAIAGGLFNVSVVGNLGVPGALVGFVVGFLLGLWAEDRQWAK